MASVPFHLNHRCLPPPPVIEETVVGNVPCCCCSWSRTASPAASTSRTHVPETGPVAIPIFAFDRDPRNIRSTAAGSVLASLNP